MIVDLLLPCVRFQVRLLPGDPGKPTDLEAAALYFIRHWQNSGGTKPSDLEAFLCLGPAVFQDMLVRMVNRGWVTVGQDVPRRLLLSDEAQRTLDMPPEKWNRTLSTLEEGKRFWLCYDLLGGGFAVIPNRFLSKSLDDPHAVPRLSPPDGDQSAPYGIELGSYLHDKDEKSRILQALLTDRWARQYVQTARAGGRMDVHILPPGRALDLSDVYFYRCRFDVQRPIDAPSRTGSGDDEVDLPPELTCVEQRNRSITRLGELNVDRILECAVHAKDELGDPRFFKLLKKNVGGTSSARIHASDPVDILKSKLETAESEQDFEDAFEIWESFVARIEMLMASQINFAESRTVPAEEMRATIAEIADLAEERIVVSSPRIRLSSAELKTDTDTALSVLAELETGKGSASVLVHGAKGMTALNHPLSDETAISRIVTALGADQVHVVDRSMDHMRTSFVLADDHSFLLQLEPLLGDRLSRGLLLKLKGDAREGSIGRLSQNLPPGLSERIESMNVRPGTVGATDAARRPAEVLASIRDIEHLLERIGHAARANSDRHESLLQDLLLAIDGLADWLAQESDSVEMIVGATIRDRAYAMLGPAGDGIPLLIGLSGQMDIQGAADLLEEVGHRLSRQDLSRIENVSTLICLPDGPSYNLAAELFGSTIGFIKGRCELLRQAPRADRSVPASFVLAPNTALIAQDGLARFVPTAGRKVKGTQLGLHLHGRRARELAASFLASEWPDCNRRFHDGMDTETDPEVWQRAISQIHLEQLRNLASSQGWFADGNLGANRAGEWIRATDGELNATWSSALGDAATLLTQEASDLRAVGHALLKATARAEHEGEIALQGALEMLAGWAEANHRLLQAAILADYLPEQSVYQHPLVRKLALCAARRIEPSLTVDDQSHLEAPTSAVQSLACLLMLDGVGGGLSGWLAYIDPGKCGGEEAEFTRALAEYIQQNGPGILDLAHAANEKVTQRLETAVARLKEKAVSDRTRKTVKLPDQVEKLRDLIFETEGSFPADLYQFIETKWDRLSKDKRGAALQRFLESCHSDLGVDLFAASLPGGQSVDINKLATEYFERKNAQMQRETGEEPVLIHRAGRNMVTSLKTILGLVLHDLIPSVMGSVSKADQDLTKAARTLLVTERLDDRGTSAFLRQLVGERIRRIDATEAIHSPNWEVPNLSNLHDPDWAVLQDAYFKCEFASGTKFHQVVQWLVNADRDAGRNQAVDATETNDALSLLHDLLETAPVDKYSQIEAGPPEALVTRFQEIVANTSRYIEEASELLSNLSSGVESLTTAIKTTETALDVLKEYIADNDVIGAILNAGDLRSGPRLHLLNCWEQVSAGAREEMEEGKSQAVKLQLRRVLPARIKPFELNFAKLYLKLEPILGKSVDFNDDLLLDLNDSQVSVETSGKRDFAQIVLDVRSGKLAHGEIGGQPAPEIARTVLNFFSDLEEVELLPSAEKDTDVWRITCAHPSIAVFNFGDSPVVTFLLPFTRDAEIDLRARLRSAWSSERNLQLGQKATVRDTGQSGRRWKDENGEILISLYFNEPPSGISALAWRYLVLIGTMTPKDRRIAVLSDLARQRFSSTQDVQDWWSQGVVDRLSVVRHLLNLPSAPEGDQFSERALVEYLRDLCLILGIHIQRSRTCIELKQTGIFEIAQLLAPVLEAHPVDENFQLEAVVRMLDKILGGFTQVE